MLMKLFEREMQARDIVSLLKTNYFETAEDLKEYIVQEIGISYETGDFSNVYFHHSKEYVIKIAKSNAHTTNEPFYKFATSFQNDPNPMFPKFMHICQLPCSWNVQHPCGIYVMEFIRVNRGFFEHVAERNGVYNLKRFMLQLATRNSKETSEEEMAKYLKVANELKIDINLYDDFISKLVKVFGNNLLLPNGKSPSLDIHETNLGFDKNNNVVIFDPLF